MDSIDDEEFQEIYYPGFYAKKFINKEKVSEK